LQQYSYARFFPRGSGYALQFTSSKLPVPRNGLGGSSAVVYYTCVFKQLDRLHIASRLNLTILVLLRVLGKKVYKQLVDTSVKMES
jgi:hypothetical protein